MAKLLKTPPLINIAPLTDIQEVPIHINNPIHPNSTNKHKRLGLQMLSELSRMEMFVARMEANGKQDDVAAELIRTVTHVEQTIYSFELENGDPSRLDNTTARIVLQRYMIRTGLAEMFPKSSEYLGIDPVHPGGSFLEARVEENFAVVKEVCNASEEPLLPAELQAWLTDLTTDIVADALFSGRLMSQQTSGVVHLSAYFNRVSSGSSCEQISESS
ncbi:hypothetical protein BGZ58_006435 [Dissophora ornata]|nr:hypothetical protein BGZ58_006435 [Dissophora ornata]